MTNDPNIIKISGHYMSLNEALSYISENNLLNKFNFGWLFSSSLQFEGIFYIQTHEFRTRLTEQEWKEMECNVTTFIFL